MPYGKGTYGSKVGRPKKKKTSKKKKKGSTKKKKTKMDVSYYG
tara:strand:- start:5469 stop:5597 length:129 start_codon:yes stop_codon:yes gene_type:complete